MPVVSTRWDIVSAFEHFAGVQTTTSSTVGGTLEVHSNCPWCPGSRDSFIMRPEIGQFTHAVRSGGCNKHGDIIDLLTSDLVGMSRHDAFVEAVLEDVSFAAEKQIVRRVNSSDVAPNKKWQEAAEVVLSIAVRNLWIGAAYANATLDYLRARGLTDETIKKARIGVIPKRQLDYVPTREDEYWHKEPFEDWGIDPEVLTETQRKKGGVRIPDGILIPWFVGGEIWKLSVKRPGSEIMPKGQIVGSVDCLYGVDSLQYGEVGMVVEAELDALSVKQEAGDLVNVVATGGSGKGHTKWFLELNLASWVLQSYDNDKAGDDGSEFWMDTLPRIERWSTMMWHDPNDLLQAQLAGTTEGFTLRDWAQLGVDLANYCIQVESEPKPLARVKGAWCAAGHTPQRVQYVDEDQSGSMLACSCTNPEMEEIILDQIIGSGASLPDPQADRLLKFASTVSDIVNIFGGPEKVTLTKHDGRSLDETYMRMYVPVTLPPMPRTKCPHGTVTQRRVSDELANPKAGKGCIGKGLPNGWCADHQGSQELLEIGAKLNYPEILDLGRYRARGIGQGVACWEAAAEHYGIETIKEDLKQIKTRYSL